MDIAAALKAEKEDLEKKAALLRAKLAQAERMVERYKSKLARLYRESDDRAHVLSRSYLAIPAVPPMTVADRANGSRTRKWSLDEPVLRMVRQMPSPVVAVPDVWLEWNKAHEESKVGRTTIRGILERLARDGELNVIEHGRPGRRKARLYQVASISTAQEEGADSTSTH